MIKKIYKLLNKNQIFKLNLIFIFLFITFIFEFVSLSSLPIFISALLETTYIFEKLQIFIPFIDFSNYSNKELIQYTGIFALSIFIIKNFFLLFLTKYQGNFFEELKFSLNQKLFNYYIDSPYDYFINQNPSLTTRTLTSDIQGVYGYINNLSLLIRESFAIVSIITILFLVSPKAVTFLTIFFVISSSVYLTLVKPRLKKASEKNQNLVSNNIKIINETFGSIKDIKVSENEKPITNLYKKNISIFEKNLKFMYIIERLPKIFLELLSIVLLILTSFILFSNLEQTFVFSNLALLVILVVRIIPAFNGINTGLTYLKIFRVSVNHVFNEFKKMRINHRKPASNSNYLIQSKSPDSATYLNVENLSYKYLGSTKNILNNLSFKIKKGDRIAITGKTGSGKSTLLYLLLGLIKPDQGNVFFNNKNIHNDLSTWRKNLSYVSQNIYLYDSSIKNNIIFNAYSDMKKIDNEKLKKVLDIADFNEKIDQLPDGLETTVGNDGIKLSGGEKQRLGIARALFKDSEFFFMDEFTSSLDNETENKIIDNIFNSFPNNTMVIVSHRDSTIKRCNKVIQIKN